VCLSCIVGVLWPKSWIDQDATWSGGRPRPRRHCYRWGPSFAQGKRHSSSPLFGPWSIVVKRSVYIHFGPETVRPMTLRHQCRTVRNKTYRNWCPVSRHFSIDGADVSGHFSTDVLQILTGDTIIHTVVSIHLCT